MIMIVTCFNVRKFHERLVEHRGVATSQKIVHTTLHLAVNKYNLYNVCLLTMLYVLPKRQYTSKIFNFILKERKKKLNPILAER